MTDEELIAEAKAAVADHAAYVAKHGGSIISPGLVPVLVERLEALLAELNAAKELIALFEADQARTDLIKEAANAEDVLPDLGAIPVTKEEYASEVWRRRAKAAEAKVARLVEALSAVLEIAERNERGSITDSARALLAEIEGADRE